MTELEKIARARMYLQKLINGVNPLDGTLLPESDIVNNERISRCLQYVSEVLGQVIENGGTEPQARQREKFAISNEQLAQYPLSEIPLQITEITARINALIDPNRMRQLSANTITTWLVSEELLYVHTHPTGKTSKYPTENGLRFGIPAEQRGGMHGEYTAVLYNAYAQRFILSHLQEIIEKQQEKRSDRRNPHT